MDLRRQRILELFEQHRELPGAPFDEAHFLDFLMAEPKNVGAIRNSFRGLKRFNRFVDDVQYEFAVCLSLDDRESTRSLSNFVERIENLERSRRGTLRSLKNQERAGAGWQVIVIADLMLLALAIVFRTPWVAVPLVLVALFITARFYLFAKEGATYLRRLRQRIETGEKDAA